MKKTFIVIAAISLAVGVFTGCAETSSNTAAETTVVETSIEEAQESVVEIVEEPGAAEDAQGAAESVAEGGNLVLKQEPDLNAGIASLPLGMFLTADKYEDGILTCTLSNETGSEMRYGKEYYLQKFVDGEWKDVEAAESYGWDRMSLMLKDLEKAELEFDLSVFGDLEPGKYQLVRDDSCAEFELVRE